MTKQPMENTTEIEEGKSKRAWNSGIQDRVLIALRDEEFTSVTALATALDVHRASASRAINALKKDDFVSKDGKRWLLTAKGQSEVEQIEERATQRVRQASERVRKAFAPLVESVSSERRKMPDMDQISSKFATLSGPKFKLPEYEESKMKQQMMSIEKMQEVIGIARGLQGSLDSYRKIMEPDRRMITPSSAKMAQWAAENNQAASRAAQIVSQQTARDRAMYADQQAAVARVQDMVKQNQDAFAWYRNEATTQSKAGQAGSLKSGLASLATSVYKDRELARLQAFTRVQERTTQTFLESQKSVLQTLTAVTAGYDKQKQSRELALGSAKSAMWDAMLEGMAAKARMFDRLTDVSTSLGSMVGEMRQIQKLSLRAPLVTDARLQMRGIQTVALHFDRYLNDVALQVPKWDLLGERERALYDARIPSYTTEVFVRATRQTLESEELRESEIPLVEFLELDAFSRRDIEERLAQVAPRLAPMWRGVWETLQGQSSDRYRQAAHSGREVLNQLLAIGAPDESFSADELARGHEGRATRKMRFRKIMVTAGSSKSAADMDESLANSVDWMYRRLSGVSHDRSETLGGPPQCVVSMLEMTQGLIRHLLSVMLAQD